MNWELSTICSTLLLISHMVNTTTGVDDLDFSKTRKPIDASIANFSNTRTLEEVKSSYPHIDQDYADMEEIKARVQLWEIIKWIENNIQKVSIYPHEVPKAIQKTPNQTLEDGTSFYMLWCFGITPIVADILRQQGQKFNLRVESFRDTDKNAFVIHLSIEIPAQSNQTGSTESYIIDLVRRNTVYILKSEKYQNPYNAANITSVVIPWDELDMNVPVLDRLKDPKFDCLLPKGVNKDQMIWAYTKRLQDSISPQEFRDFWEDTKGEWTVINHYPEESQELIEK